MTFDSVAQAIRNAHSFIELNAAAERIQEVPGGADAQAPLHNLYKQRSDQLKGKS